MERNLWIEIYIINMDVENLAIVRQTFANTVFTHKVQEVAAENAEKKATKIKIANILLISVVLILLILQTANSQQIIFSYIGAGVTVAEIIFLIAQLSFGYEQKMTQHKNSALKYMQLRDRYRSLIADIMGGGISAENIRTRRDHLQADYQVISDLAPQTGPSEYEEAQKRLNKKGVVSSEQFTWSDEEIDRFLPSKLRIKK